MNHKINITDNLSLIFQLPPHENLTVNGIDMFAHPNSSTINAGIPCIKQCSIWICSLCNVESDHIYHLITPHT